MSEVGVQIVGQNVPVGRSEPASATLDFAALKEAASKLLPDDSDEPITPPADAVVEPPVAATPVETDPTKVRVKAAAPVTPEAAAALAAVPAAEGAAAIASVPTDLADDALVKVTVDGEETILPWGEAKGKISGGLKFTKNMQTLAKEKSDFAAEQVQLQTLRTERANLEKFLENEAAVTNYVKTKFPHLFQQPAAAAPAADGFNPDEIATLGQARTIAENQAAAIAQQIAEVRNSVKTEIDTANAKIAHQREVAKHAVVIDTTLADIFKSNPVLNSIPNASDLIRYEVAKLNPATEADAVEGFKLVAAGMVEEIGKHFKATQKLDTVAAAKQKLVSHSIEPAGGASPQLKPTSFKDPSGQIDWKKVTQAARDFA